MASNARRVVETCLSTWAVIIPVIKENVVCAWTVIVSSILYSVRDFTNGKCQPPSHLCEENYVRGAAMLFSSYIH